MGTKNITVTPQLDQVTTASNSDDDSRLEQGIVRKHLIEVGHLNTYQAETLYGIRELRTVVFKLKRLIPIEGEWIIRPHPETGTPTRIKTYWLESHTIERLNSAELVEALAKQQESIKITKLRVNNIKALQEMCSYSKRETIDKKLDEFYGKKAANDD